MYLYNIIFHDDVLKYRLTVLRCDIFVFENEFNALYSAFEQTQIKINIDYLNHFILINQLYGNNLN